jgi:hypothetical protein
MVIRTDANFRQPEVTYDKVGWTWEISLGFRDERPDDGLGIINAVAWTKWSAKRKAKRVLRRHLREAAKPKKGVVRISDLPG